MINYPYGIDVPTKPATQLPKKGNKFNAHKMIIDGHQFDSKAEGAYYLHLKNLKLDFKIHEKFETLPSFDLQNPRKHVRGCTYTPDFSIYEHGKLVSVVDVKGGRATLTRASVLRMKMFMAKYRVAVVIAEYDAKNGIFEEY
ncbi:DUF1064 domain-containing protein [Lentilactobacillus kefiri]|uniref:DUF1064 domain-containing protein n=1 Tax=Lentilactobacillus kefiri TaxID=33962 RepID=UPI0021C3B79B|nr:DUF1064 domain-containing protein [Lentilactobacillus kefiri]MCP9369146.1 DUF1064 domain-containing protein [Lentilactobacillus kefiri]